jgi:hypothetical protein
VEHTHACLAGFGKLRIRFEWEEETHLTLLTLAYAVICLRFMTIKAGGRFSSAGPPLLERNIPDL